MAGIPMQVVRYMKAGENEIKILSFKMAVPVETALEKVRENEHDNDKRLQEQREGCSINNITF